MEKIQKHNPLLVQKSWGFEKWIENCEEYCGKLLFFEKANSGTSMHFHSNKLETMFCAAGRVKVMFTDPETAELYEIYLDPGECVQIPRNQLHKLTADLDNTTIFEFSTKHEDSDSYRAWR